MHVGGDVNWYSHYREYYGDSLKKLKVELPYDPDIYLFIYLAELGLSSSTQDL